MMESSRLAADQLRRMRGMNRFYHERFFADVRFSSLAITALFVVGFWDVPKSFLLVPPLALMGAAQTAFDASYLIFSRQYSERLEQYLNTATGEQILVAHELEDRYLFPLNDRKIVTASLSRDFSWFGFMTIFYTVLGVLAFAFALALGWPELSDAGDGWTAAYVASLAGLSLVSLLVGWWWFVTGAGERRLRTVLDERFGGSI